MKLRCMLGAAGRGAGPVTPCVGEGGEAGALGRQLDDRREVTGREACSGMMTRSLSCSLRKKSPADRRP